MSSGKQSSFADHELLPTTYLSVLSLIGSGTKYGYEINQIMEERGYRNWLDIKMSSIYKALNELEKRGLIKGRKSDAELKPAKKTFNITAKGRRELEKQILRCLSNPPRVTTLFDLGMSAIGMLTRSQALDALRAYRQRLDLGIQFLEVNIDSTQNLERYRVANPEKYIGGVQVKDFQDDQNVAVIRALFERPLASVRAQREWLNELIVRILQGEDGLPFKEE